MPIPIVLCGNGTGPFRLAPSGMCRSFFFFPWGKVFQFLRNQRLFRKDPLTLFFELFFYFPLVDFAAELLQRLGFLGRQLSRAFFCGLVCRPFGQTTTLFDFDLRAIRCSSSGWPTSGSQKVAILGPLFLTPPFLGPSFFFFFFVFNSRWPSLPPLLHPLFLVHTFFKPETGIQRRLRSPEHFPYVRPN